MHHLGYSGDLLQPARVVLQQVAVERAFTHGVGGEDIDITITVSIEAHDALAHAAVFNPQISSKEPSSWFMNNQEAFK